MAGKRTFAALAMVVGATVVPCAPAFAGLTAQLTKTGPASNRALRGAAADGRGDFSACMEEQDSNMRVGGAFVSMLAALIMAFMPVAEAQAAKAGGRMGGTAPSMKPKPPPAAAPRSSINNTTIINRTTVVAPPPVVAPPVMIAPAPAVVLAPPPTVGDIIVGAAVQGAVNGAIMSSIPRGPSTTDRIMENQMRQDERQLDRQAAQIDDLKRELAEMKK